MAVDPTAEYATTLPTVFQKPIFEFGSTPELLNPPPQSMLTADQSSSTSLSTETTDESLAKQIPTGTTAPPRLKFVYAGRSPILKTRQRWEGAVTELRDGGFVAVLTDKTDPQNPDEQVFFDFENSEISDEDLKLVQPGSSFYWIVGTEKSFGGQVRNVSMLQFRRMPAWTKQKLAQVAEKASQLKVLFLGQQ